MEMKKIEEYFSEKYSSRIEKMFKDINIDFDDLYNMYKDEDFLKLLRESKDPWDTIKKIIIYIENVLKPKNIQDYLAMMYYIGVNTENFYKKQIEINRKDSGAKNPIEILLELMTNGNVETKVFNFSDDKSSLKSKYSYKLEENKIYIVDESKDDEKSVTNDIENILNEIIEKESFEKIQKLRVFSKDTYDEIYEVIPIYSEKKCISVTFEKIS